MLLDYLSAITWDIDPVMLRIGPVTLRYYGVLFALALAVGYMIIRWRYKEEGEDPEKATNLTYALMAAIVIGSRLAHCLFYEPERYLSQPLEILKFWNGGLASHGAAAGMILTCVAYDWFFRKTPLRNTTDRLAFGIPFAMICVRLGNFFNSEIVGAPCDPDSPLAFIFPRHDMVPRYPSQLFEVGMGVVAFAIMWGIYYYYKKQNRIHPLGLPTGAIITAYFTMRFFVEYFKEYQEGEGLQVMLDGHEHLTNGQMYSIPFIIIGVLMVGMCLFGPWRKQTIFQFNKKYRVTTPSIARSYLSEEECAALESDKAKDETNKSESATASSDKSESATASSDKIESVTASSDKSETASSESDKAEA